MWQRCAGPSMPTRLLPLTDSLMECAPLPLLLRRSFWRPSRSERRTLWAQQIFTSRCSCTARVGGRVGVGVRRKNAGSCSEAATGLLLPSWHTSLLFTAAANCA